MKTLKFKLLSFVVVFMVFVAANQGISAFVRTHKEDEHIGGEIGTQPGLSYSSCLHYDHDENGIEYEPLPNEGSEIGIPKGSTMILHIYLKNPYKDNVNVSLQLLEGLEFMEYTEGVLVYFQDDKAINASIEEYEAFKNQGLATYVDDRGAMTFEVKLKSTSSSPNQAITNVYVSNVILNEKYESIFVSNFEAAYHTITVYDNENIQTYHYEEGKTSSLPILEKEGHQFLGYSYTSENYGDFYQNSEVYESFDLYALFQKNKYKINYYVDDKLYETHEVEYGEEAPNLEIDEKVGYNFQGWSESLENIISDKDVHAVFETKKYTIHYYVDDKLYETIEVAHGQDAPQLPYEDKEGLLFQGWNGELENITSNQDVHAILEKQKYQVNYYIDGKLYDTKEVVHGEVAPLLSAIEKEGYIFQGWDGLQVITGNTDIHAIYKQKTYKVHYYVDGTLYQTLNVNHGEDAKSLPYESDDVRIFQGWSGLQKITSDKNVYAIFEERIQPEIKPIQPPIKEEVQVVEEKTVVWETVVEEVKKMKETKNAKIKKISSLDGLATTNTNKTKTIYTANDEAQNLEVDADVLVATKEINQKDFWLWKILPFIISGISIVIFIAMQRKSKYKK